MFTGSHRGSLFLSLLTQAHIFAFCCTKLRFNIVLTSSPRPRSRNLLTNYLIASTNLYLLKMPYKSYRPKKKNSLSCSPVLAATELVQCMFLKIKNLCFTFCILYSLHRHHSLYIALSIVHYQIMYSSLNI
jgi:hypothetical protein